jgi:hypothetical protein
MTIATAEAIEPSAPTHRLRVALIVISAIATLGAAKDVPGAFYDYGHTDPLLVFAQRVTTAKLVVSPFIAGVALLFALLGRVRGAVVALAALMLAAWVSELPSIPTHGLELSATGPGLFIAFERLAVPVLGVAAIVFALRNTRLVLATVFVTLPMLVFALGVAIFAIGVALYGF